MQVFRPYHCTQCGHLLAEGDLYCTRCGFKLFAPGRKKSLWRQFKDNFKASRSD